jgi:DNA repair exonuclease SbcCD ATPase subunit
MSGFVVAVLALLALVYVAAPLRDRDAPVREGSSETDELIGRKRAALTAILDMEEERDAGKLSEADFAVLRQEYEAEAAAVLVELDALRSTGTGEDADVEAEIAAIRTRLQTEADAEAGPVEPCPSCGTPRARGRACEQCGA